MQLPPDTFKAVFDSLEQSEETFFITDLDGVIVYANPAFERLTGYAVKEVEGKNAKILKSGEHPAELYAEMWTTIKNGSPCKGRLLNKRKDGSLYTEELHICPVKDGGVIKHFLAILRDITEQLRAEREIRLLQAVTQKIAEAADLKSALVFVLQQICETTGWILGEAYLLSPDRKQLEFFAAWTAEPEKLKPFLEVSLKTVFPPGIGLPGRVWASGKADWIPDVTKDANFPRAAIAVQAGLKGGMGIPVFAGTELVLVMDFFTHKPRERQDEHQVALVSTISSQLGGMFLRKKAEEESAKIREQLLQSQKMEALGLLAGQLSHDFNNLLTIIIGSMELIMEDIDKKSVTMKLAQGILQASKESANLIRQLLIFARRQEYVAKVVNLNDVVTETGILLDRLIGTSIKIAYDLHPDLSEVTMEPEQFKQALINLVINAKDAMPSGGAITIRTFNQSASADPSSTLKTGDYAVVEVSDTGPGIPPQILQHIFEPFFTTKPKGKGTGLGLSMVYGVVTQYKGEVLVNSRPGHGTVFTIRLPKAECFKC